MDEMERHQEGLKLLQKSLAAIQLVRELHQPVDAHEHANVPHKVCPTCGLIWPCPTIKALEG